MKTTPALESPIGRLHAKIHSLSNHLAPVRVETSNPETVYQQLIARKLLDKDSYGFQVGVYHGPNYKPVWMNYTTGAVTPGHTVTPWSELSPVYVFKGEVHYATEVPELAQRDGKQYLQHVSLPPWSLILYFPTLKMVQSFGPNDMFRDPKTGSFVTREQAVQFSV